MWNRTLLMSDAVWGLISLMSKCFHTLWLGKYTCEKKTDDIIRSKLWQMLTDFQNCSIFGFSKKFAIKQMIKLSTSDSIATGCLSCARSVVSSLSSSKTTSAQWARIASVLVSPISDFWNGMGDTHVYFIRPVAYTQIWTQWTTKFA